MEKLKTIRLVILIVLFSTLGAYSYTLRYEEARLAGMPNLDLVPKRVGDYTSRTFQLGSQSLDVLGADTTLARTYYGENKRTIELFIGFYRTQQKNSQIHSPRHCYPGSGWDIIREGKTRLSPDEGETLPARSLLISDGNVKRLVIYWFYAGGRSITGEFSLKWQQMKASLLGRPQAAAFIRFSVIIPAGEEKEAREDLLEFIKSVRPAIDRSLGIIFSDRRVG